MVNKATGAAAPAIKPTVCVSISGKTQALIDAKAPKPIAHVRGMLNTLLMA